MVERSLLNSFKAVTVNFECFRLTQFLSNPIARKVTKLVYGIETGGGQTKEKTVQRFMKNEARIDMMY